MARSHRNLVGCECSNKEGSMSDQQLAYVYTQNNGFGYSKSGASVIAPDGTVTELFVTMPSAIAPAQTAVAGGMGTVTSVRAANRSWWVGNDALLSDTGIITSQGQQRLSDPAFLPAMVKGSLRLLQEQIDIAARSASIQPVPLGPGMCVTGLPAEWQRNEDYCVALGQRMREGSDLFVGPITVLSEPVAILYAAILTKNGELTGDPAWLKGRVGCVDLGHHTNDYQTVARRVALAEEQYSSPDEGMRKPLARIRGLLQSHAKRGLTIHATDMAVRQGFVTVGNTQVPLPAHWDTPLIEYANGIAGYMLEIWGSGSQFDALIIAGGGSEVEVVRERIRANFPQAIFVSNGQMAIAQGYARYGVFNMKREQAKSVATGTKKSKA